MAFEMLDEHYLLSTPENVPISYELAGVGSRFIAILIDDLIIGAALIGALVAMALAGTAASAVNAPPPPASTTGWAIALGIFLVFAVWTGYFMLFEIVLNGQTPGKRLLRLRVTREDGRPITALAAVIRNVMRIIDFLPVYYITGIATMLIDKRGRRLGDLAAGTMVVKERSDVALADLAPTPATVQWEDVAGIEPPNIGRLSLSERRLVQEYLARRERLSKPAAKALAQQIAGVIADRLEVARAADPEAFLAHVGKLLLGPVEE